jgi:hypothetical protein
MIKSQVEDALIQNDQINKSKVFIKNNFLLYRKINKYLKF